MLPFLKSKKEGSAQSDGTEAIKRQHDEKPGSESYALEFAMNELFNAKTNQQRAAAFRAAFEILEMQPHEES